MSERKVLVIHDPIETNIIAVVTIPISLSPADAFERWCYIEKEAPEGKIYDILELHEIDAAEIDDYNHENAQLTRRSLGQAMTAVHEMTIEDLKNNPEAVEAAINEENALTEAENSVKYGLRAVSDDSPEDPQTPIPAPSGIDPQQWEEYWDLREWEQQHITFDQWKRMKDAVEDADALSILEPDGTIPVKPDVPDTDITITDEEVDAYANKHDTANQL